MMDAGFIEFQTPILTSSFLNQITNAKLFFKCENFQRIGAFKIRGATNFVQQIKISFKFRSTD